MTQISRQINHAIWIIGEVLLTIFSQVSQLCQRERVATKVAPTSEHSRTFARAVGATLVATCPREKGLTAIPSRRCTSIAVACLLLLGAAGARAQVVQDSTPELKKIDVIEHLGEQVPLDLIFTNDAGDTVKLGDYFHQGRPVILVLAYYTCPMLCTLVLNGLSDGVKGLDWLPGKEFQMLTVSIDPSETPQLAAGKKSRYLDNLGKQGIENGWRFFVGAESQSRALAEAVGFKYYYDTDQKMYAHPAVVFILTEDGTISRYLYGLEYKSRDLKLALLEASQGRIGNTIDRLILYCYHYDPNAKGYVMLAGNIMRLGGAFTLIVVAVLLGTLWARERLRRSAVKHA